MAIEGGKQYIISHAKQATIEGVGERRGGDLAAYVMEHADIVREYGDDPGRFGGSASVEEGGVEEKFKG